MCKMSKAVGLGLARDVVNLLPGSWTGAARPRTLRVEADWVTCTQ